MQPENLQPGLNPHQLKLAELGYELRDSHLVEEFTMLTGLVIPDPPKVIYANNSSEVSLILANAGISSAEEYIELAGRYNFDSNVLIVNLDLPEDLPIEIRESCEIHELTHAFFHQTNSEPRNRRTNVGEIIATPQATEFPKKEYQQYFLDKILDEGIATLVEGIYVESTRDPNNSSYNLVLVEQHAIIKDHTTYLAEFERLVKLYSDSEKVFYGFSAPQSPSDRYGNRHHSRIIRLSRLFKETQQWESVQLYYILGSYFSAGFVATCMEARYSLGDSINILIHNIPTNLNQLKDPTTYAEKVLKSIKKQRR